MGIETVAIYSEEDADSPHRFMADYSYPLKGRTSAESYLDIDQVINAMKEAEANAQLILATAFAESAAFAEACEKNGFVFIGPAPGIFRPNGR